MARFRLVDSLCEGEGLHTVIKINGPLAEAGRSVKYTGFAIFTADVLYEVAELRLSVPTVASEGVGAGAENYNVRGYFW